MALINPHKGKFNVTAKGGLVEEEYVDWVISRPYIFLVLLNLVGVAVGIWRYFYGPPTEMLTVVVSMVWVFYNLIVLGGAVAVSVESKQVRRSHRVEMTMPAAIAREDGHLWQDSYPEDKPLESLLDILKLGFRGYRHLAEFAPSSVKGIFRVLTSLVSWVVSFIPRRPERSETAQPSDQALAQQ